MIDPKSKSCIERRAANRIAQHLKNLKDNPLKFWKDGQKVVTKADKTIAERRVASLIIPFEFARAAKQNRKVLRSFLNCGFFEGQTPKEKDLLPRSIEWHFGCRTKKGPLYDRCWTYARAMKDAFEEDLSVDDVKTLLHRNIEKLSRSKTLKDDKRDDVPPSDDSRVDGDKPPHPNDSLEQPDTNVNGGDKGKPPAPPKKQPAPRAKRKSIVIDPSCDIVIRAAPDEIRTIESLGIGTKGRMRFIVSGINEDGWAELEVTDLKI